MNVAVRALIAIAVGFGWIFGTFGARIYLGGKRYLTQLFGDEAMADRAIERLGHDENTIELFGMHFGAWSLLATASAVLAMTLTLLVLLPTALGLHLAKVRDAKTKLAAHGLAAAFATALLLTSVHPVLNLKAVPEGPRTFMNYAFEAAGYGWTNALAYLGAVGIALGFAWLGLRTAAPIAATDEAPSEPATDTSATATTPATS